MKPFLIVMSGLPFSGKSTIAQKLGRELGVPIVSYDHDIYALHKDEVPPGTSAAKEFEMIETIARTCLARRLANNESIIYDDLCLEKDDRNKLLRLAKSCNVQHVLVYLDTPMQVIHHRRRSNMQSKGRKDIGDAKLRLDSSLLQPPGEDEMPVVIGPATSFDKVLNEIQTRIT